MKIFQLFLFSILINSSIAQIHCDSIPSNYSGTCSTHYSDGVVKSVTHYSDGVKNGEYLEYYHHGELGAKGSMKNGSFIGKFERYSPTGIVILSAQIEENGAGELTEFNYNGEAVMTKGTFDKWRKSGIWKSYNYKGDVLKETEFNSSNSTDVSHALIEEFGFGPEPVGVIEFPTFDTEFPGGPKAMNKFIQTHVQYPEAARKKRISGRVYVSFIVNEDGSISDAEMIRDDYPDLGREAVRLVNSMPPWVPAVQGGMRVKARAILPITFALN